MSAVELQQQVIDLVRARFTRAEVAEVRPYGGEFSADEVAQVSYVCPAIFISVLGWTPEPKGLRLVGRGVRGVRLAAFVATKHAKRELRMAEAMTLAERLGALLSSWTPVSSATLDVAPLEADPTVENLYGRGIDRMGQALWLVDWTQAAKPLVQPAELFDLLAVEITDTTHQGTAPAADPTPPTTPLLVTEDVQWHAV